MDTAIRLVSFDVAGTTVSDDGLVIAAFNTAFSRSEPELWNAKAESLTRYALATMGQSKIEVFTAITGDIQRAQRAVEAFEEAYFEAVRDRGVEEIPGATETIIGLRDRGIQVSLTTGFSRVILEIIISQLGWTKLLDFSITPQEAGGGRPSPLMLIRTADALRISDPEAIAVAGDTMADMKAGAAFGAGKIFGVLTGTHNEKELVSAGATSIVHSVADIPSLI